MKATYIKDLDCKSCVDLGWLPDDGSACAECIKINTHTVEVLKLGVGMGGDKAVVKDSETGELLTVGISKLKMVS